MHSSRDIARQIGIKVVLSGIVGLTALLVLLSGVRHISPRVIWTSPPGVRIEHIISGKREGSVLVLCQRGDTWSIWSVEKNKKAQELVVGKGLLDVRSPASMLSSDRNRLLVALAKGPNGQPALAMDCNIDRGEVEAVAEKLFVRAHPLCQVFSPDGRHIVLLGSKRGSNPDQSSIWMYNRETGIAKLVRDVNSIHVLSYAVDGSLYALDRVTGTLYSGLRADLRQEGDEVPGLVARFSPSGERLVVGDARPSLKIYGMDVKQVKSHLLYKQSKGSPKEIEWSQDGRYAVVLVSDWMHLEYLVIDDKWTVKSIPANVSRYSSHVGPAFFRHDLLAVAAKAKRHTEPNQVVALPIR